MSDSISGQYPLTHGVVANDLPMAPDAASVGEAFRDAGYRTGYVGKWHVGGAPRNEWIPPGPERRGFDDCFWITDEHDYFDATYYGGDDPEPVDVDGYEPVWATDRAIEFVESGPEPFCLVLSWGPPHDPYELVPDRYAERYEHDDPREILALYYAAIAALDDTLVCYTSDHGDMLYSQGLNQKGVPYGESIGVPLLARWPDEIPAGTTPEAPIGLADLAGAFRGEPVDGPDAVFLMGDGWRGVRTRRYTYARVPADREPFCHVPGGRWLLFDDEADPFQQHNVVFDAAHADVADRLDRRLDDWLDRLDDPFDPIPELVRRRGLVEAWNERVDYHAETKAGGLPDDRDAEDVRREYGYRRL